MYKKKNLDSCPTLYYVKVLIVPEQMMYLVDHKIILIHQIFQEHEEINLY